MPAYSRATWVRPLQHDECGRFHLPCRHIPLQVLAGDGRLRESASSAKACVAGRPQRTLKLIYEAGGAGFMLFFNL